ncbi:MAG TPA: hypothetical protein VG125_06660 [Pirellulales bacterium]|jgi:hypothetical protein|nr:hypothetical protein [Pirellulales bacterium]
MRAASLAAFLPVATLVVSWVSHPNRQSIGSPGIGFGAMERFNKARCADVESFLEALPEAAREFVGNTLSANPLRFLAQCTNISCLRQIKTERARSQPEVNCGL